ncbi:MAG: hypothetical protein WCR51_06735 [Planctomycetia bacterium]
MRLLVIDHGCCDPPATRVHALRAALRDHGGAAVACGPSSIPGLAEQPPGLHGIHFHDIAAANRGFLAAVRDGSPAAFLAATGGISPSLLGLARETARQTIAEAVDTVDPAAIIVLHAGILADLAIETGVPVVVHVAAADLDAAAGSQRLAELVTATLGSAESIVAADAETARRLGADWLDTDTAAACETWPATPESAALMLAACHRAIDRRS